MLLHGAWNAGAILSMAGGVGIMLAMPEFDILSSILTLVGLGLLFFLISGMFVALFWINARLRTPSQTSLVPLEMEGASSVLPPDEQGVGGGVK
jgi:hypothetical protein